MILAFMLFAADITTNDAATLAACHLVFFALVCSVHITSYIFQDYLHQRPTNFYTLLSLSYLGLQVVKTFSPLNTILVLFCLIVSIETKSLHFLYSINTPQHFISSSFQSVYLFALFFVVLVYMPRLNLYHRQ
jgi:hypothetical protein